MMFHPFLYHEIANVSLPEQFTYPFYYKPHPLCKLAAQKVQNYLLENNHIKSTSTQGKMFGVLVVQDKDANIGFLAAFSGLLGGSYHHDYFVPPIYDLLAPDGFFRTEESKISIMNREIAQMEQMLIPMDSKLDEELALLHQKAKIELNEAKERIKTSKERRDIRRRNEEISPEIEIAMIKESQFLKAEYKRLEKRWKESINHKQKMKDKLWLPVINAKEKRKKASAELQQKLFEQFHILNACGEEKTLCDIFSHTPQKEPPAGAGECAAPKLLQYAYVNKLKPLAMAEFWWGQSPKSEIRIHGYYYPACKHKCGPILEHMLKGLDVEPNLLSQKINEVPKLIRIVYEDEFLLVVDKPSGILSVPGKNSLASVYNYIKEKYSDATGPLLVHRLDMDTSGLLLVAKSKEIHEKLQMLFEGRKVKKEYIALLEGTLPSDFPLKGFIKLPLRPDYENRPCQLVDFKDGKIAVTRYNVLNVVQMKVDGVNRTLTRVAYYPQTGRTHQLRVHSASALGMNCPIMGDSLYGQVADRLYLHASKLEFRHPVSGENMKFHLCSPF